MESELGEEKVRLPWETEVKRRCPDCRGTGRAINGEWCSTCHGTGIARNEKGVLMTTLLKLTEDRHQQALYRLSAVAQYLYDTMNGDHLSSETGVRPSDPLPEMAMAEIRRAQEAIDLAIKHGQRARRRCLGGEIQLVERPGPCAPDESTEGE